MPVKKVGKGFRYGQTGKVYPTKRQANKQAAAIHISKARKAKAKR